MEMEQGQWVEAQEQEEVWVEEVDDAEVVAFLLAQDQGAFVSARAVVQRFLIRLGHHAVL